MPWRAPTDHLAVTKHYRHPLRPTAWLPAVLLGWMLAAPLFAPFSHAGDEGLPTGADSSETLVVQVIVNQAARGDRFVYRDDAGFYLQVRDLIDIGLSELPAGRRLIDGEEAVALRDLPGLTSRYDEATLTLSLDAAPQMLPVNRIDFGTGRRPGVVMPLDSGGFLNYGVGYTENDGERLTQATAELGWRSGEMLLLTDGVYTDTTTESRLVRLNTRLIRDDRTTLQRITIGDLVADTGVLGSRLPMGGVGIAKVFSIDPYFTQQPLFHFAGLTQLPATVEVFQDGNRIRTEKVDPGQFSIDNLRTTLGARDIQIVVRDSLGRETIYDAPYYFASQLLSTGLHEYNYNIGALREEYGTSSDDYADLAWAALHRYGLTKDVTVSGHSEGGDGLANIGSTLLLRLGPFGVASLDAAASKDGGEDGCAGGLGFEFLGPQWQSRLQFFALSQGYATLGNRTWGNDYAHDLAVSIGYLDRAYGSLTFSYFARKPRADKAEESYGLTYTRNLGTQAFLSASYTHQVREQGNDDQVYVSFNYYLDRNNDVTVAASHRHDRETDSQVAEIRRNAPVGTGYGWRATAAREQTPAGTAYKVNPFVQVNGERGIYRAEYAYVDRPRGDDDQHRWDISAAGAIVSLGGAVGLIRPVQDSFALVKVGEVENVRVYVNNREVGRTAADGTLFVPELSSYFDNQVRIEDIDIPIDYLARQLRQDISPPLRSGSCVNFPLLRYQAFTGTLRLPAAAVIQQNLPNHGLVLKAGSWTASGIVDVDGTFYVESNFPSAPASSSCAALAKEQSGAAHGSAQMVIRSDGITYTCPVDLPAAAAPVTDLGTIRCTADSSGQGTL
jgi:outer membrane usher protein